MPRWASRLTLEVTSVRVERLHCLTIADAKAEGIEEYLAEGTEEEKDIWRNMSSVENFAVMWDKINGKKYPWSKNCWVFVVEFRKLKKLS
jgi:hypothetical protein